MQRASTIAFLAVLAVAAPSIAGDTFMDVTLAEKQSAELSDGTKVTFDSYTVEEIAASPIDPKAYPAGSGVTFTFTFEHGKDKGTIQTSQLSTGYDSKLTGEWKGYTIRVKRFEGALTPDAKVLVRLALPAAAKK